MGRTSGDAAWREQRGELGATEAAKQKVRHGARGTGQAELQNQMLPSFFGLMGRGHHTGTHIDV